MDLENYGPVNGHRAAREAMAKAGVSVLEFKNRTGMPCDRIVEGNLSAFLVTVVTGIDEDELYEMGHD